MAMNEEESLNALLRTRLHAFTCKVFETLNPGGTFLDNWHIKAVTHQLEKCERGDIKRLIFTLPPRHLKSIIVSVAFTAWILGRDPTARIMCISYADDLAAFFSRSNKEIMKQPWFKKIFPAFRFSRTKNTEQEIVTTAGGYRLACSIRGGITGRGAMYIIIDDPIKANEAMSETERRVVIETFKTSIINRLDNVKDGVIIIVMQRVHYEDLAGFLMAKGGWEVLNLPAIAEEPASIPIGDGEVYDREEGEILHPDHMGKEGFDEIIEISGSNVFNTQFQQNPAPPGGNAIKLSWFKRYEGRPDRSEFSQTVQSWDTAAADTDGANFSVCETWGIIEGRAYLLHVLRERLIYPDLRARVLRQAETWGADRVLIEQASTGLSLLQDLSGSQGLNLIPRKSKLNKLERAHQASAAIEAGRVFLPEDEPWLPTFESEVSAFPESKYKDQVDSMTQFLLWWEHGGPTRLNVRVTTLPRKSTYFDRMGGSFSF
jgi:predicted phage terminase large subunit-like protein